MTPFKLDLEKLPGSNEGLYIYRASGKLSLETVNEFLPGLRAEAAQRMVLDLSGVNFLDSAGVGALVSLFVSRRNQGKQFGLAALQPQASAVVRVAGLQNLLPIYKTVEEATAKVA
ncbi:MAG TPA: STAS domain-containing protein [Candidatus Eisenbacteria bacterium]|nr:STAS domain-containing protein [Candidatus Eisenbacteria bacterium]